MATVLDRYYELVQQKTSTIKQSDAIRIQTIHLHSGAMESVDVTLFATFAKALCTAVTNADVYLPE